MHQLYDALISLLNLPELARVIIRNEFNFVWCAATVLYFLGCLAILLRRAIPIRRGLARVRRPLKAVADPEGFAKEFETYSGTVQSERYLAHVWREFCESLVLPRADEPHRIRNTREPGYYFNDATVVQPVVHNRFFDTVPSHLVGLGILGTFVGLAAGVGMASGGLQGGDLEQIKQALGNLLSGASLAFFSSIFGLSLSLAFLWIERWTVGRVHRELNGWVESLERLVELVTPEQVALLQLEEAKTQSAQLERFNTDLIFALENALEERVAGRLLPELQAVVRAIEGLRLDRADSSTRAIEGMIQRFSESISGAAGQEISSLSETLRGLNTVLQESGQATRIAQGEMQQRLLEIAEGVRQAMRAGSTELHRELASGIEAIRRALESASVAAGTQLAAAGTQLERSGTAAAERLQASLAGFSSGVAQMEQMSTASRRLIRELNEALERVGSASSALAGARDSLRAVAQPLEAGLAAVRDSASRGAQAVEGAAQIVGRAEAVARRMDEREQALSSAWEDYQRRFEGIDRALQGAFQGLEEGLTGYTNQVATFARELDQHTARAIDNLRAAIGQLDESIQALEEARPR